MQREEFWALIESTRTGDDCSEHADALGDALSELPAAEIVDFARLLSESMEASYTWALWGAAYLINGGCSDDGFDYFRGWLILQGRSVFEKALADPDSLADLPELEEDVECEEVLYLAQAAHEDVTGNELPRLPLKLPELGEGWDFDDDAQMKQRYPKLFARFCED